MPPSSIARGGLQPYPGIYSVYQKLNANLGDRRKLNAAIMTLSALLVIIIPGVQLAVSSVDGLKTLNTKLGNGELKVPPPPEGVGNLLFIGGFISFGFLGLFIGAVILSVVYKLLEVWLQEDTQSLPVVEASGPVD